MPPSAPNNRLSNPTIKDVAHAAGVSPMTASRALSGRAPVSAERRRAVERVAKMLGYRPNAIVQSVMSEMRRRKSSAFAGTLAFLNSSETEDSWRRFPYNREFLDGVRERAAQKGYVLDEIWIGQPGWTAARTGRVLAARGIRAFLVVPGSRAHHFDFPLGDFSMVSVGGLEFEFPVHRVLPDYARNYAACYRELRALGYRRIGMFAPECELLVSGEGALGGFLGAQWRDASGDAVPPGYFAGHWDGARTAFEEWFLRHRPDAVIGAFNQLSLWLRKLGARVPGDVGLAHPGLADDVDGWSGIDPCRGLQGAHAVDLLIGQVLHGETGLTSHPKCVSIAGRWVAGKTTRKIKANTQP